MWKDVVGHPDYQVSNLGRVRKRDGKILHQQLNENGGYSRVWIDNKRYYVRHIVADAFCDIDRKGKILRHVNGITTDNRAENLTYRTVKYKAKPFEKDGKIAPKNVSVVYCGQCKHRNTNEFCSKKDDFWYCSDGELE